MVEQAFITSHNAWWNITALRCMSFKKLWKHIMSPFVFAHWKAHIINKYYIISKLILSAWDCPAAVPLTTAGQLWPVHHFSAGCTLCWQISDVHTAIFEVFHTLLAPRHTSPYTRQRQTNMYNNQMIRPRFWHSVGLLICSVLEKNAASIFTANGIMSR